MTIQRLPGSAITPGTITVTQLDSATATVIQTGGGPKITNIQVTDAAYTVLDDTAVDTAGGNIRITGTGFVTGCSVIVGSQPASSVAFISSTEVRVQVGAQSAGTYIVYLVNPDGGVGIRVNGLTYSANPAWQTASALPDQYDGVAISLSLVATEATSYTITSGSLPPGLSLNANTGVITGTVTGVSVDTVYTFTVRATDAQLQDSPRTFTVTITVSDPYFKLTTLLLSGSAISANTVIRDSSTNNFNLTVYGDTRASNFTPYGTGWSVYFDGTGDYLTVSGNSAFEFGTGNVTIEAYVYRTVSGTVDTILQYGRATVTNYDGISWALYITSSNYASFEMSNGVSAAIIAPTSSVLFPTNAWTHLALVRSDNNFTLYQNGVSVATGSTSSAFYIPSSSFLWVARNHDAGTGDMAGYISNARIVKGTAVYTANFTPATTNLTAVANTSLLTCHVNGFRDASANNFTVTRNGDAKVVSFNPFNITNTGVNGSAYFDGTGDYLYAGSNIAFQMGTGDFTYECYVYHTNLSGQQTYFARTNGNNNGMYFYKDTSNYIGVYYTGQVATSNITITTNQWYHLVATRLSGILKIFINGTEVASVANTTNLTEQVCYIGADSNNTNPFFGYISNARILKGTGYSSISVPTQPLTAIANTQLLTLQYDQPHNNHTFLDSSSNQFLITRNGNASQGTFSPFSQTGWSVYINNGTSSQITIADNAALRIGTSAFTIESWVYPTSFSEPFYILRKRVYNNLGAGTWAFTVVTNGAVTFEQVQGPSTIAQTSAGLVALNTWTHVAISRDSSNNVRIFLNGTIQATATSSYNFNDASNPISLLCDYDSRNASSIGYASNLRFVIGSAVYTANFTPATSNLTSSSQGAVAADVKILTFQNNRFRDASTNNFTITISGSPSVQAFSPFATTAVYSPAIHGGSAYFDGSGDWINFNTLTAISGAEDFTIELWIYIVTAPTINKGIFCLGDARFGMIWLSNNLYIIAGTNAASADLATGVALPVKQWCHLAVTRTSGTVRAFINGSQAGTTLSNSQTLTANWRIGNNESNEIMTECFVSGARILRGIGGTSITVPAIPLTPTINTQLLLNFTDAAVFDSTGRNALETLGDAKSSSVITKFTGGSMYFDGTGDYVKITPNYLTGIGTGDFTIEGWWYFLDFTTRTVYFQRFWSFGTGLANDVTLNIDNSGYPVYRNNDSVLITASTALSLSTWTHVALVRYNGTTRIYINGTDRGNTTTNNDLSSRATNIFYIGSESDGAGGYFYGYVSDFRITRYARYTANFTAPTVPARLK